MFRGAQLSRFSIGSAVLAQLIVVTNRQTDTDHGTSVTISRISALSGEAGPLAARGGGQICALKRRSEGVRGCGLETDGEPV